MLEDNFRTFFKYLSKIPARGDLFACRDASFHSLSLSSLATGLSGNLKFDGVTLIGDGDFHSARIVVIRSLSVIGEEGELVVSRGQSVECESSIVVDQHLLDGVHKRWLESAVKKSGKDGHH